MKSAFGLRRIMPSFFTLLSVAAFSLLAGCGQKGPLYLPNPDMQQQSAPPVPTAATPAATGTAVISPASR